ncbi:hypothetical protein DFP73DRAFT_484838 [Morchella snyderi]|nr:hypothetical protein DFP73DRAFT_484838 [Morchella snyderi]
MSAPTTFIALAQQRLPPLLHRFFAQHPPGTNHAAIFRHTKSPLTGKWHNPKYSLRRQKELVKAAHDCGVEELLPETVKAAAARAARAEVGPRLKRMLTPKGKGWERALRAKLEVRKKAMEGMPKLIDKWRKLGHGRGWKEWPR